MQERLKRAEHYLPGGVNSPVRAFKSVGGSPVFMQSAKGAYLTDADGKKYIDYINSWGPMILGHAHPTVLEAMAEQLYNGISFGTPTELETEVAKKVVDLVPNIEQIRFVNSGTEACMSAIRLARGYTKKNKFIKFEGCYHGHADAFLIKAGSGAATFGTPSSSGVTPGAAQDTLLAPYNDLPAVEALMKANTDDMAAIILEPIAGNMGCIVPEEKFILGLRKLCDQYNALLIFDEVMTGFRVDIAGAQKVFDVQADILCFGKVIGGGMPVGAFASTKEIMSVLAPNGPVYQAGTLSGNPLAMRCGLTTLEILSSQPEIFDKIAKTTQILDDSIQEILTEKGITHTTNRYGSMFSIFFSETEIKDFETAKSADNKTFKRFFHHLLNQGIYLPPSSYETWFISNAIDEMEIEKTLEAVRKF